MIRVLGSFLSLSVILNLAHEFIRLQSRCILRAFFGPLFEYSLLIFQYEVQIIFFPIERVEYSQYFHDTCSSNF
jgi:hypothetical protein